MNSKVNVNKIGPASMVLLFLNLTLAKYLLVVPSFIVSKTGNSAWMVLLIKGVAAEALFILFAWLYKPFVSQGFAQTSKLALGAPVGTAVNILTAVMLAVRGSFLLRMLIEALRMVEAENSTIEYIALFVLVPVFVCALKGFNANVNLSIMILPFTVVSIAVIGLALIPHYRPENITPILGNGASEILSQSFIRLGGLFEVIYIFIFSRYLGGYRQLRKSGIIGIAAVSLISFAFTLMYCLVVPYPASQNFFFPLYLLTRMIKAGSFMQRMEPIVIFIWAGIVICALVTVIIAVCELFKISIGENQISGFMPLVLIMLFFSGALPRSELEAYTCYNDVMNFSHFFYLSILLFTLVCARVRRYISRKRGTWIEEA